MQYWNLLRLAKISCYFQRLVIFYRLKKKINWKRKGCGSRQPIITIIWYMFEIFLDRRLWKVLRFTRIKIFSEIRDFFHIVWNLIEKVKDVEVRQTLLEIWCIFEICDNNYEKVITFIEDFMLFSEIHNFSSFCLKLNWKCKGCGSRPDSIRIIWCICMIFWHHFEKVITISKDLMLFSEIPNFS